MWSDPWSDPDFGKLRRLDPVVTGMRVRMMTMDAQMRAILLQLREARTAKEFWAGAQRVPAGSDGVREHLVCAGGGGLGGRSRVAG